MIAPRKKLHVVANEVALVQQVLFNELFEDVFFGGHDTQSKIPGSHHAANASISCNRCAVGSDTDTASKQAVG